MGVTLEYFTVANPNSILIPYSKRPSIMFSHLQLPSSSPRLGSHLRPQVYKMSLEPRQVSPIGFGVGSLPLCRPIFRHRSIFSLADSHEEAPLEIGVNNEKNDVEVGAKDSQEVWKQTLASFKEQLSKMQGVSQEAYEIYSKKAIIILKETSEQLKIQAEKARDDLDKISKEISEEGKGYLSVAAEKSPEPVKDIVETFASSTDELNEVSKVRDFYLGIPYGLLLSCGGFLSFMLTGSISAIRFGFILGGVLLALSISSLRSWRKEESSLLALRGQTAIAIILFLREMRLQFVSPSFIHFLTAFVSGAMTAFYIYRIIADGSQTKGSNLEPGSES